MSEDKARHRAFLLLDDIIQNKKYANLTLKKSILDFEQRDRSFIVALVYGTLDKLITIDYVISLYAKGKIQPKIRNILRMGVFQIMFMDKVPDSAAVSTSVDIAQKVGKGMLKGYINGVLRNISRNKLNIEYPKDKHKFLSSKYSYPEFFVKDLVEELGFEECEKFCSFSDNHRTCIRVDENKANINEIKSKLNGQDSIYFNNCFYIEGEPQMLENGICSVQSEASVAVVKALGLNENDTLLDCCAAPGGKTVYAATFLKNGKIMAFDKHAHRVELIKNNAKRCGYSHIIDSKQADMTVMDNYGVYDKVLVDAVCSGLGVVGQKPEIKNTVTPEGLREIEKIQAKILENASKCVKNGGVLVYSTCTVRKKENIDIINNFLKNNKDFVLSSMEGLMGEKFERNHDLKKGYIQLYPHTDKTDGFFIARMLKS
ncbi:MAG: 16S rRNA (cytosine(967)-C(5))-methyltransferase RsmB [Clostridiales bacterium]|nr:16S rRNA (cytosine(967)-C(5))-methyltransferase RsmB [Clostridiales bacterium]